MMNIGVIGGGSIGLLLSGFLSFKHEVTIYVRRHEQKKKINEQGLFLNHMKTSCQRSLLIEEIEQEDCVFICVKQPDVSSIIPYINQLPIETPIIFLQNGMGHVKQLTKIKQPIYLGIVEHGAQRVKDFQVIHTGKGVIRLACFQGDEEAFSDHIQALQQTNFPFDRHKDWKEMLQKKLIINAIINPLTALFQVKNISIVNNQHIRLLAKKICKEAADILNLDYETEWKRTQEVAHKTGENYSSMVTDLRKQQATELEAILGYLLIHKNKKMPYITFVYQSIKALEIEMGV